MPGSGGVSIARTVRGDTGLYNPPPMRKLQQEAQLQQKREKVLQQEKLGKEGHREQPMKGRKAAERVLTCSTGSKNRVGSRECGSSDCSSGPDCFPAALSNLDRFLEHTTPAVPAQYLPKSITRESRTREVDGQPYFVLGDLWESFQEWSAYGAGVPLLLNGRDSVVQYYVPYLSGIQLYKEPARPGVRLRRPDEESDAELREMKSSDGGSNHRTQPTYVQAAHTQQSSTYMNILDFSRLSLRDKSSPLNGENEVNNSPGQLVFEYLERDPPFSREPLANKILVLASRFPELMTYRSCDLSPSSWISVAWYPIYRIPIGQTLQNLDACFLTFHTLATPSQSATRSSIIRGINHAGASPKLTIPSFGLASYKFKVSAWTHNGNNESQNAIPLLQAADDWLKRLRVNHPDYCFFKSHNSQWR